MKLFGLRKRDTAPTVRYSECERVTASPTSPTHIRVLTDAGLITGGGADSDALCSAEVAWDIREITLPEVIENLPGQHATFRYCTLCVEAVRSILGDAR